MNRKTILTYYPQVITAFIIAYVAFRIFNVDITNDEAYSFHNVKKFWYAEFLCTGNSHWLNSLWMWICTVTGLEEVFFLRLFSFASFLVFVYLILKFLDYLNKHSLKVFALCVLLLNPFMLDYFVLARGYAWGLMFEMLSIMCFFKAIGKAERKFQLYSLVFACLSAIANYSFVYYLVSFALVYFIHFYISHKKKFYFKKTFYADGSVIIFTLLIIFFAIRFISRCSNDYIGAGTESPGHITEGVVKGLLYLGNWDNSWPLVIVTQLFVCVCAIAAFYGFVFFRRRHENVQLYQISFLFFVIVLCFFVVGELPNGVYPEGRSALFIWPVAMIMLVFAVKEISHQFKVYLIYGISILLLINFSLTLNSDYTLDFKAQRGSKKLFEYLESKGAKTVALPGELYGVYVNYYQIKSKKEFSFRSTMISNKTSFGAEIVAFPEFIVLYPPYDQLKYIPIPHSKNIKASSYNNLIILEL